MPHPFFERHRALLDRAVQAIHERSYWSAFPESASPKVYGEGAAEAGKAAFDSSLEPALSADAAGDGRRRRRRALAVRHPARRHLSQARHRRPRSRRSGARTTSGARPIRRRGRACASKRSRASTRPSFEIANAVMHTTGQAFMMAFQAGGPHAQDRGLEAVAYAWDELSRVPRDGAVGKAAGQERADPHGEAVSRRAARHRSRHRLLHVSDVERLPGSVREPRDRQRGGRQAASGRDPAARDHGAGSRARCSPKPASIRTS